jgi:hypothetical protein
VRPPPPRHWRPEDFEPRRERMIARSARVGRWLVGAGLFAGACLVCAFLAWLPYLVAHWNEVTG